MNSVIRGLSTQIVWILAGSFVAAFAAGGYWWFRQETRWEASRQTVALKTRMLEAFRDEVPAPTQENAVKIDEVLNQVSVLAHGLRSDVLGTSATRGLALMSPLPAQRSDTFFDLARFVDSMRRRCEELGISVKEKEYFGFSLYANSGPEDDLIDGVVRQRDAAEGLLTELFQARPLRFESLRREQPVFRSVDATKAKETRTEAWGRGREVPGTNSDFFALDPEMSLRKSGKVDTLAFRLSFVGETSVLRSFLNRLAGSHEPWWVRQIEVTREGAASPDVAIARKEEITAGELAGRLPAIEQGFSLFVVTVERIEALIPSAVP